MFSFNIRVYGILMNEKKEVLVSDELIRGMKLTKFPGGGLEFGEGTRDCLVREFLEEMNLKIEVSDHLYTTDHFQVSAFNASHQVISIYYFVKAMEDISVPLNTEAFCFTETQMAAYETTRETECFRFIPWQDLHPEIVSLPIDKLVVKLLKEKF